MQVQANSVVQVQMRLLISWLQFIDTRRETQFLKVFRNHSMLTPPRQCTAHLVVFKISIHLHPQRSKILTAAAMVENTTLCPNGRNSFVCRHGPMSTLNWLFFKIREFSAHLFWAWRHPHSSPISCQGFIITMVMSYPLSVSVKLYPMTMPWTKRPE